MDSVTVEPILSEDNVTDVSLTSSTSQFVKNVTAIRVVLLLPLLDAIKLLQENSVPARKMSKEEPAISVNLLSGISNIIILLVVSTVPVT